MQCSKHCSLYPAETPNLTASCNWGPPTPWSLRLGLCVMGKCTPEDDVLRFMSYTCMSITRIQQNLLSSLKKHSTIPLLSKLFHDTRVAVLDSIVVAWPEAHVIWVLLQADGSQSSLVTQQVQHVPGILPGIQFKLPLLLTQCVELDMHLYCAAIHNLVYGCGNVPQTTAESRHMPPIYRVIHNVLPAV